MNRVEAVAKMNDLGRRGIPFVFIIDFEARQPIVLPAEEAAASGILYDFHGRSNCPPAQGRLFNVALAPRPVDFETYRRAFAVIQEHLAAGHSYLANLTFPTGISLDVPLDAIFRTSRSPYRLLVRDAFVVFSPETFLRIRGGTITTHPMKGTINASYPDAEKQILQSEKETAEHTTIVDLLRNDLGIVARRIRVERFRYIDRVPTHRGELLQVCSEIAGDLSTGYEARIGEIVFGMLPAGSVTGAPKGRTVEILKLAEGYERGFFTGVAGIFDNGTLESCVLIRFIERIGDHYVFKSGGGITFMSDPVSEYDEMIQKVYVPSF